MGLDDFLRIEGVYMTEVQKQDFMEYIKYQYSFGAKIRCYQDLKDMLSGYNFQTDNMRVLFRP